MSDKKRILVVEDDKNLGTILSEYLNAKNYETELAVDGELGLEAFAANSFDLCILDVMMPKKDGFTLAQEIRQVNKSIPIIFLTAKSMKEDTLQGFEAGADDYLTKPFSMEELLARMNAIFRRVGVDSNKQDTTTFQIGKFKFDSNKQILEHDGVLQKLTSKENELLRLLAININGVLDRTAALNHIWNDDSYFNSRSMDVYITKLRKHLKADETVEIINVHGQGFKLRA